MFTFKHFRRKDEANEVYLDKEGFPGWERVIHVYKGDLFLCQINTAQAFCCGFNTIEKLGNLCLLSSDEIPIFWEEVSSYLDSSGKGDYRTDFRVGELFCLHNGSFQDTSFYKESGGEVVHQYVSKSEPHHPTFIHKFTLCSS